VKNLARLLCSIPLLFIASHGYASDVLTTSKSCPVQAAAVEIINSLPAAYPNDWRIVVACSDGDWLYLQRKADAMQTDHAFTNLQGKITVIRGEVFLNPPQFRPAKLILLHELGHITCQCENEDKAEDWARKRYQ
jgi:hypothetical protein